MTNSEQTRILEKVASGELTIEQASQLLERLDAESSADAEHRSDRRQRAAGLTRFTGEQIATLRDYEIDADYIQGLEEAGFADLTVEQLIALKNYEVDADYIKALRAAGFANLTVEQLVALKNLG